MTIDDTLVARGDEWTQWWLGWSGNRDQRLTATGSPPPPLNPRLHGKTLRTPVVQKNPEEELGVVQDLLWNLPPNGRIVEGWLLRQLPQFLGVMVVICFKIMFVGSTFCFFCQIWSDAGFRNHFLNSKIPEKELQETRSCRKRHHTEEQFGSFESLFVRIWATKTGGESCVFVDFVSGWCSWYKDVAFVYWEWTYIFDGGIDNEHFWIYIIYIIYTYMWDSATHRLFPSWHGMGLLMFH